MENENGSNSQNGASPNKRSEIRGLRSERKRKKIKILKDENKQLKDLLKQISHTVSNSGLLNSEQQEALAEAIAREDNEILDADQNVETVDSHGGVDFAASPGSKFEPPNPSAASKNPTNGFQFSQHKSSAVVMPSVKQTPGSNFFLNNLDEVVKDLDSADELDATSLELKSLREQICFRCVDLAPISPLPPTPPPKTIDNNTPRNLQKPPEELDSSRHPTPKKHSLNHQRSEGFDAPSSDQNTIRLSSTSVARCASVPVSSISDTGFGKYEFVSKRSTDGGVMLSFSLKDDISLNLDSNTWQITCHIPDPKRKQPECTPPNRFEAPAPPGNPSCAGGRRNREDGCAPFKRQKLSYSEEVPEMVLPSMQDVDIGNFGKEHESRFLVPSNQSSSGNSALLLKEHSSFNQVTPNYLQGAEDVLKTPSAATGSCQSSQTRSDTLFKSPEDIKPSLKPNAKIKTEKVASCLDDDDIYPPNDSNFLYEEISLKSETVSRDASSSVVRNSLKNNSAKRQRKRSVANVKDKNIICDQPFESNNKNSSTDLKTPKQTSKKQKMTPLISADVSISKSTKAQAKNNQPNKISKKLLKKVQKVESEENGACAEIFQEVQGLVQMPSNNKGLLGNFELELSTKLSPLDENQSSTIKTDRVEPKLLDDGSTFTQLNSQDEENNMQPEGSRNLVPEKKDESKISLKKFEPVSSSELSSPEGKQNGTIKSEEIKELPSSKEVDGKLFLRKLGLISSSERTPQEENTSYYLSSSDNKGELDSSLIEASAADLRQCTPKKESVSGKLRQFSSSEKVSQDEKKIDPNCIPEIENKAESVLDSFEQSPLKKENSCVKERSLGSMKHSSSENKDIKGSSKSQIRRRSSSKEEKRTSVIPIEPLPQKRSYRRSTLRENQQSVSLSNVPQTRKKGRPKNVKCSLSENKEENDAVNLRLRSSSQEGSQEEKLNDSQNKTPLSANKGKKGSMKESSLTSQEQQSSPEIGKRLRSVNLDKKANNLQDIKRQSTPKVLKRRQTAKNQYTLTKAKARGLHFVSDSESESENIVISKLFNVNGNNSSASMPVLPDISTQSPNPSDVNRENEDVDERIKVEKHKCQKSKLDDTLPLSCNSDKAEYRIPSSSLKCKLESIKDFVKDSATLSAGSVSSKSLLVCKQEVTSPVLSPSRKIKSALNVKKEPIENPPDTNEMNFNEIELDSFNPNAFTSIHVADRLQNKASDILSTDLLSSNNLLTDVKFSFLDSCSSLGKSIKQEDGKPKKTSASGFSFLDLNSFSREIFSVPIKKELLDSKTGESSPKANCVSKDKPQTGGDLLSDSSPNAEHGFKDDSVEHEGSTESPNNPDLGRSSGKETSEPKSSSSGQEKSSASKETSDTGEPESSRSGQEESTSAKDTSGQKSSCSGQEQSSSAKDTSESKSSRSGGQEQSSSAKDTSGPISSCSGQEQSSSAKDTSGPISSYSGQEQSSSLNSEENGENPDGRNKDSDEEGALVIADDAEPELHLSESEKSESSDEVSNFMPVAKPSLAAIPKEKTKKTGTATSRKSRRTPSADSTPETETGIIAAFKHLDRMKYSDAHSNYNTHFLYSAFINPEYSLDYLIYFVIKHLSTSKRNPLLSYSLNRDSPLLPLPEDCIVKALFKASTKPRLEKLLPSTKRSLYNIILAKQKLPIYGLCSLCRVFTEICKRKKDKREVISLCCDLVLKRHKYAAYMIASITGLWRDLFTPSDPSSEEEKVFFGAIAMVVQQKPKTLTQTQWNHCSVILSETMTVELPSDIKSTIEFLEETIKKKCLKGKFANAAGLRTSLVMIAQMQEWDLTKELILDSFIIPCLKEFSSEEMDERAFSLFCSLYGDISALCPDSQDPKDLLIHLFETKAGTHVQVSAAVTLLQLYLVKREAFPDFLGSWLATNHSHPKVAVLSDLFHQSLIADNELLQTDIAEC